LIIDLFTRFSAPSGFKTLKILPLTYQIKAEIARRRGIESKEFYEALSDPKFALTSTPLLLSMLIEMFLQNNKLPENRAVLYHQAIDIMIKIFIKKYRKNTGNGYVDNDKYKIELFEFISKLAHRLHTERVTHFTDKDILEKWTELADGWKELKEHIDNAHFSLLTAVPTYELVRYKFYHLSFQGNIL